MSLRKDFLESLEKLIAIPSVIGEKKESAPFGTAIGEALDEMLAIAEKEGYRTYKDPEGYYGYAEIGEGEEHFGILGHLDVVPIGKESDWDTPPYELTLKDGYYCGRGVTDDKGPTLLVFYALKELLEEGMKLRRPVRFILGTDEENAWRCMDAYVEKEKHPLMGFTPDSSFPLVYAEKGVLQIRLTGKGSDVNFLSGEALNVVPSEARYPYSEELEKHLKDLGAETKKVGDDILVIGKNSHASRVEDGINAFVLLLSGLSDLGVESPTAKFVKEKLLGAYFAEKLLKVNEDDLSGKTSVNLGRLNLSDREEIVDIDMRYPVSFDYEETVEELRKIANEYGFELDVLSHLAPIHSALDSELVTSLLAAYREVTEDMTEPQISGGATYARAMDNLVAFGANFPWSESTEHQPNERATEKDLLLAFNVYKEAMRKLVGENE